MRSIDAASQEERPLALADELLADPPGDEPVAAIRFIVHVQRGPIGLAILPRAAARQANRTWLRIVCRRERIVLFLRRIVVVPGRWIDHVVEQLSGTGRPVTVIGKMARHKHLVGHHVAHLVQIVIQAGAPRRLAGKDRRARRVARSRGGVCVAEKHPAGGEPVNVRCFRLWVPAEAADPVVQIVHRDEEDIGRADDRRCGLGRAWSRKTGQQHATGGQAWKMKHRGNEEVFQAVLKRFVR